MIGTCRLLDTQKTDAHEILHIVENPTFRKGDVVHISLDWEHRYFYMQEHTAQHAISGTLFTKFSIGTVAVHEGEDILTVETDHERIEESVCFELEDEVNKIIREGHPVFYEVKNHEAAERMGLRRSIKVEGDVRLVVIEGVDVIACGGLHVANTREITLVQYIGQEMIRSHVRLIFRVAGNAVREIRHNRMLVRQMCALHSAQPENLLEVEKQELEDYHTVKADFAHMKLEASRSLLSSFSGVKTWDVSGQPFDLKDVAQCLDGKQDLALCAVKTEGDNLYWLFAFCGTYHGMDFNAHRAELLSPIQGKGGGRAPLYQGMGKGKPETLFQAFDTLMSRV